MAVKSVDYKSLNQEATSLAEEGFLKKHFKSSSGEFVIYSSAQHLALKSYVEARLFKRHPHVSIAALRNAAEVGVDQTFATQGDTSYAEYLASHGGPLAAVGGAIVNTAEAPIKTAETIANFVSVLTDPTTWLRGVYIVGGGLLVLSGVFIVAKELGAPTPTPPIFHAKKLLGK